jgi:uncharacterized protein DUF2617
MFDPVYFSLFAGVADCPVTIFNRGQWTLDNGIVLETCIIGKSHRVISRGEGGTLTEFIACSADETTEKPLDHFSLQAGKNYTREYQVGNIQYAVTIDLVPRLFKDMEGFLESLGEIPSLEIMTHRFEVTNTSHSAKPFTGVAVDLSANGFYTVHTYPEDGLSIVSKTNLYVHAGFVAS